MDPDPELDPEWDTSSPGSLILPSPGASQIIPKERTHNMSVFSALYQCAVCKTLHLFHCSWSRDLIIRTQSG